MNETKKKQSLLDPDALAAASEDEQANYNHGRRPSFEAELFGDAPSNAAEALMNDKELAGV